MRHLFFIIVVMAILAASLAPKFEKAAPDSSTIVVVLVGSDLYIRSAWNQAYDKVQRLGGVTS